MTQDEIYMGEAIKQAKRAYRREETPIGCVIVYQDKIIARGYNKRNWKKNTLAHAEILAVGGLYYVCDPGAMPYVCRGYCTGQDPPGSDRQHEPEGRVRRIGAESAAARQVQPPGRSCHRRPGRRMQPADERVL